LLLIVVDGISTLRWTCAVPAMIWFEFEVFELSEPVNTDCKPRGDVIELWLLRTGASEFEMLKLHPSDCAKPL